MSWHDDANCRGMALEIFYVGSRIDQERMLPEAKAACDGCSVRSQCLEEAIQQGDVDGVRGGLLGRERRVLIKYRKSLIPKKERPDHGTRSGYLWELRNGRVPCRECRTADNRYKAKVRGGYVYGPVRF